MTSIQNLTSADPFANDTNLGGDTSILYIHIRIFQRSGRKALTTIEGLPKGVDFKKILKFFKKEFCCNGSLLEDETIGTVVQLQGDHRKETAQFLIEELIFQQTKPTKYWIQDLKHHPTSIIVFNNTTYNHLHSTTLPPPSPPPSTTMDQTSDDKKRPSEDNGTPSGRPTKRALSSSDSPSTIALSGSSNALNASGPNAPDQNILLFQNRAMKIRVEEQKHEISDKEVKIRNMSSKLHTSEEIMSTLCRVWDQVSAKLDIDSPYHDLNNNNNNDSPSSTSNMNGTNTNNNNGTNNNSNNNNNNNNNGPIESSYGFLASFISEPSPLDDDYSLELSLQNRIKKTQSTFSKIVESVLKEHSLSNTVFRLLKSSKDITSNDYERLLKDENERLSKHNQILQNAYDKLQIQIKYLNDQTSHLADQSSSYQLTSEEFIDLQKQSDARLLEARKLREEKANLLKDLQQMQVEIRNIPEERIQHTMGYSILTKRMGFMTEELEQKSGLCAKLQADLIQLSNSRRQDLQNLETTEIMRRQTAERRINQLEAEATELKSEKEKLIEIIEHRNPNVPSQEYITESRMLLESKDQDIAKIKKEIETLKENIEKYKDYKQQIILAEEKANRQIEVKNLEIKEIMEKLRETTRLNEELKEKEKKLIEKEKELQLSVQLLKSSSSEQVDSQDLRISENKLKHRVEELEKEIGDIEESKKSHNEQLASVQEKHKETMRELEASLAQLRGNEESHRQESEALMGEIDSMGKEYEKMTEQNTRLMKQLSDKEDTHAHLMAENIKAQQAIRISRESQMASEDKALRIEEKLKQQNELLSKMDEKASQLQKQLLKVSDDFQACSFELEKFKRITRETAAHSQELKVQVDHLSLQNQEWHKKADESIFALERESDRAKRLEEDKQQLKKKLDKANANAPSSVSASKAEEELKNINQRLRCTVCNDRQKNYVIAKCFHVFCKECIYSNIDTRKRKCPICMGTFSGNDVHQVYI
ncbi:RING zinc finger-containing protein [Cavenderia fasciculata]|uniref:E3 ubiquitin protein ligase n=1 Tax=Cavenderia fasciculata TaxID=261658 RepID=F4PN39_CACFS|nr:RING zinc finger-containing protein [Cavenderia fasciculata]EGG23729.1 RING zinc finger-containing protein [Cavenderia fasciculata]|eukprot:XP_004361580.1 RING zinc finger-containing protein [Cavenderia fasciculata]